MISISKSITLSGGKAPYSYSWSSNFPCLTFNNQTGTTNKIVNTVLNFIDEPCIGNSDIKLTIVDKDGCSIVIPITVENPCANFDAGNINLEITINAQGKTRFIYTVTQIGGVPSYSYFWTFDQAIFTIAPDNNPNSNTLILELIPGMASPGLSTQTKVLIIDNKGCERESIYNYTFCLPQGLTNAYTWCNPNSNQPQIINVPLRQISANPCGIPINWESIEFVSPKGVTVTLANYSGNNAFVNIQINTGLITNLDNNIYWTVADSNGSRSVPTLLKITLVDCDGDDTLYVTPSVYTFPCTPTPPPSVFHIIDLDDPLNPYINSSCPIDWSTFTFIAGAGQTLINSTTLITPFATVILNLNHELVYEWTTNGNGTDLIQWQVCNTCNPIQCTNTVYNFFVLDCIQPPVAVNDTICVACNETILIDVLANDTGTINPNSIQITQSPTLGVASVVGGQIQYTANTFSQGTDILKYKVSGFDPNTQSNEATVTIDIVCAGASASINQCD